MQRIMAARRIPTGEAEPRGSSCVLYDTYNTFCTIHIRNIECYEWASVVCRKAQVVQSLCPYIHGVSSHGVRPGSHVKSIPVRESVGGGRTGIACFRPLLPACRRTPAAAAGGRRVCRRARRGRPVRAALFLG